VGEVKVRSSVPSLISNRPQEVHVADGDRSAEVLVFLQILEISFHQRMKLLHLRHEEVAAQSPGRSPGPKLAALVLPAGSRVARREPRVAAESGRTKSGQTKTPAQKTTDRVRSAKRERKHFVGFISPTCVTYRCKFKNNVQYRLKIRRDVRLPGGLELNFLRARNCRFFQPMTKTMDHLHHANLPLAEKTTSSRTSPHLKAAAPHQCKPDGA